MFLNACLDVLIKAGPLDYILEPSLQGNEIPKDSSNSLLREILGMDKQFLLHNWW